MQLGIDSGKGFELHSALVAAGGRGQLSYMGFSFDSLEIGDEFRVILNGMA